MTTAGSQLQRRARRVLQTFRTFTNWGPLLAELAGGRRAARSLSFKTRTGLTITCPNVPGARVPIYEVFAEDCYHLSAFLGAALREPLKVIDIGAHVGTFACELARLAPAAEIYCFEPSPVTAGYLEGNVAANGLSGRVHVSRAAVAAKVGEAVLVDNGGGSALNSLAATEAAAGVAVPTTTFDAITEEIGGARFVKIDCEGGEYDLVFGSAAESWRTVERVVIEYHPHPEHDWAELRAWLAERGLEVAEVDEENPRQGTAWLVRVGT